MKRFLQLIVILAFLVIADRANALDPVPAEPGWSGYVNIGGGVLSAKTNMVSGIKKSITIGRERIDSFSDKPDTITKGIPALNFNINYTFPTQTLLFLGNSIENIVELDRTTIVGVRQQLPDKSLLELALVTTPFGTPVRVWKDPYVVGEPRDETNRTSRGLRVDYDRILGSGFGVQFMARKIDIDKEQSGTTQLGLSPDEADLLKRTGNVNRLSVNYRTPMFGRNQFQIRIGRLTDDIDGKAMSGDQNEIQLTHAFFGERFFTAFNAFYWDEDYDKLNPVFAKTREDKTAGLAFMIFDTKIFNSKNWWGQFQAVWVNLDSNIDFYDASSLLGSLSAMYRF